MGAYFLSLDMGYRSGDLSVVYPIARSAPLFVPLWATVFIGESIRFLGKAQDYPNLKLISFDKEAVLYQVKPSTVN